MTPWERAMKRLISILPDRDVRILKRYDAVYIIPAKQHMRFPTVLACPLRGGFHYYRRGRGKLTAGGVCIVPDTDHDHGLYLYSRMPIPDKIAALYLFSRSERKFFGLHPHLHNRVVLHVHGGGPDAFLGWPVRDPKLPRHVRKYLKGGKPC